MSRNTYNPALAPAPLSLGALDRAAGLVAAWWRAAGEARAARRRAREGARTLMAMGDRDLRDIGISRSQILSVVYGPSDGGR